MSAKKASLPMEPVDLGHLTYDSTNKIDYGAKEARVRSGEVFLTAALLVEMEETWGGSFAGIKTITDKANQRVYLFPAGEQKDGVVAVHKSETLANATFSFTIPLQLLELKLRKDRQIVLVPQPVPVMDKGISYCFNFKGVRASKRPRTGESEGAPATHQSADKVNPKAEASINSVSSPASEPKPKTEKAMKETPAAVIAIAADSTQD